MWTACEGRSEVVDAGTIQRVNDAISQRTCRRSDRSRFDSDVVSHRTCQMSHSGHARNRQQTDPRRCRCHQRCHQVLTRGKSLVTRNAYEHRRNNYGHRGRLIPQLLSWVGPAMRWSPATLGMFSRQSTKPSDGGDEAQQYCEIWRPFRSSTTSALLCCGRSAPPGPRYCAEVRLSVSWTIWIAYWVWEAYEWRSVRHHRR